MNTEGRKEYARHPDFPALPVHVPLTYVLTLKACLSDSPAERPPFVDIGTLLTDTIAEVASGEYVNSEGSTSVRPTHPELAHFPLRCLHQ